MRTRESCSSIKHSILSDTSYDRDTFLSKEQKQYHISTQVRMPDVLLYLQRKRGFGYGDGERDFIDDKDVSWVTVSKPE
jgi:hypothetical protein